MPTQEGQEKPSLRFFFRLSGNGDSLTHHTEQVKKFVKTLEDEGNIRLMEEATRSILYELTTDTPIPPERKSYFIDTLKTGMRDAFNAFKEEKGIDPSLVALCFVNTVAKIPDTRAKIGDTPRRP